MKVRGRSRFHSILVEDDDAGVRTLHFGDTIQSALRPGPAGDEGLEYVELFHIPVILRPGIRSVLFIGLGGASGPRQFARDYPRMQITVVELDPEVIRIAAEMFGFETSTRCQAVEGDGAEYLRATRRKWDLIVVDAYTTEGGVLVIPHELTTADFFALCSRRLRPEGVLLYNCAADVREAITRELHRAMSDVFPNRLTFALPSGDNTVLIGSTTPLEQQTSKLVQRGRAMLGSGALVRREVLRHCRSIRRDMSENFRASERRRRGRELRKR